MEIVLYYNKSEKNKIDKDIEEIGRITGDFKTSVSITKPVILCEFENVPRFNYIYINSLERYYFVNRIDCVRTGIFALYCQVDVLESYMEYILNQKAFVERSFNKFDLSLMDDLLINDVKKEIYDEIIELETSDTKFTSYEISNIKPNCVMNLYSDSKRKDD